MHTRIIKMENDREKIAKAIDNCITVIKKGGILAFPTETSYALGCDATNNDAVRKVFQVKGRDPFRAMPIVVSDARMAQEHLTLDERALKLVHAFMPGPLSLIVEGKNTLSQEFWPKERGVAFRIPGKDFVRLLTQQAEGPLVATSANISGKTPIYRADELKETFEEKIDLIIDAGNLPPIRPSTIIDLRGRDPIVVREGPLSVQDILHELRK